MKKLNWFSSNILAIKTGEPTEQWNSQSALILEKGSMKLGFIGINSYELLGSKLRNDLSGFYFKDPVTTILRTKNRLKKEKVDLVILYYQGSSECKRGDNFTTPLSFGKLPQKSHCDKDFEITNILERLPPDTIDLVLANFDAGASFRYRNTPIIGMFETHEYLTGIRLNIQEGQINFKNSYFLEPLKLCHETFVGTHDCVLDTGDKELNEDRFERLERSSYHLLPARFFGYEVKEDQSILKILNDR